MSETEVLAAAAVAGEFTCESCGQTFEKERSDEEAASGAEALIPAEVLAGRAGIVCDNCFRRIMGRVQLEAPELLVSGAALVPGACYRTPGGLPVHYTGCWCPR